MPTYEYECTKGHQFEVVQSIKDDPLERCTVCRAKARRLISATNFILKGGGWYSDGYSENKGGKSESKDASTESSSSTKSSGSSSSNDSKSSSSSSSSD